MRGVRQQGTAPVMAEDPLEGTPYRSTGILGQGAMGIVLDAEHRALRKRVCVKVLLERHIVGRPDLVDRMRAEAQALANLSHEGLVEVNDFGMTPGGRPYFVMERLSGRTLKDELDVRIHVTVFEALRWAIQALETLAVTHDAGIVHRDLKPANLFLCQHAEPKQRKLKILDFGVAKFREGAQGVAPLAVPTEQGAAMGTPRYLAPEQILGHPVDGRTDVYAMGLVISAMLAGRGPFDDAPSEAHMAVARIQRPAPALSTYAKVPIPRALDAAVARALSMSPEDRFPSVRVFADELARIADTPALLKEVVTPKGLSGTEIVLPGALLPKIKGPLGTDVVMPGPPSSKLQATLAATVPMVGASRQEIIAQAVARASAAHASPPPAPPPAPAPAPAPPLAAPAPAHAPPLAPAPALAPLPTATRSGLSPVLVGVILLVTMLAFVAAGWYIVSRGLVSL